MEFSSFAFCSIDFSASLPTNFTIPCLHKYFLALTTVICFRHEPGQMPINYGVDCRSASLSELLRESSTASFLRKGLEFLMLWQSFPISEVSFINKVLLNSRLFPSHATNVCQATSAAIDVETLSSEQIYRHVV